VKHYQLFSILAISLVLLDVLSLLVFKLTTFQMMGYKTDLGTTVSVIKITQDTLVYKTKLQLNYQQNYTSLFNQPQRLSLSW
jgi:polysaccharide export outer membrane protein